MADARPYRSLLLAQVRAQAQYRASFVIDLLGSLVFTTLDLGTVFILFNVHGSLGGFGGREVLLMAALTALAFPLADLAVGNVERLRLYVRTGLLDSLLIRPLPALMQLLLMDFAPRRIGRVLQGLAVYLVALAVAGIPWTPGRVLLAVLAPVAGAVFFASLFVAGATVAFWWIESGEFAASFTYGGKDFASYPLTMYRGAFRTLFAFGLGFAFVAYLPALALLAALIRSARRCGCTGARRWPPCSPRSRLFCCGAPEFVTTGALDHDY